MSQSHMLDILDQNNLSYKLTPISIRELLYIKTSPCAIYTLTNNRFQLIKRQNSFINKMVIKELLENGHVILFIPRDEKQFLFNCQQENLRKVTRSLSIGDALENGKQAMNLITLNLAHVYAFPTNNELLKLQYQSAKNLATFLLNNVNLHEEFYQDIIKQKHYYIYAQPLLSSLFLLGVLKYSNLFTAKDIESFFITSYFKDIGMSAIPAEKYQQKNLEKRDKQIFLNHPTHSANLLRGRIPLLPHHLKIIEHHHAFSRLSQEFSTGLEDNLNTNQHTSDKLVVGIETMLTSMCDIIAAMITDRPYQEATGIFEALEKVKELIVDNYPQEFRLIVSYFKNFFFKNKKQKAIG